MKRSLDLLFHLLDWILVLLLVAMTAMVFVNVVLRYGFGNGLDISDEMSRFCFVWLIFLGSVSAMRRNMHMGFDLLVVSVSPGKRRVLLTMANGLILAVCLLILTGTIMQWHVNATNIAPVTRLPMIWVFGVAVPMSVGIGIMAGWRMIGYATGRLSDALAHGDAEMHQ
ncbi:TRAP transporter small permease [Paracoccus sp. (in: a-proteobacteria)]|uniref:TRAP transporter small permease n=1 Tax=Paracoccus sp. TaxID=267 RepID=UPI003A8A219F